MHYHGYNTGKINLTEGAWFPFRIHKLVQLQDEEWYYILEDMNGLRHFIYAENYKYYGFKPGDEISCKIDKINCTGRLFLEPRHPHYNAGEIYSFDLVKCSGEDTEKTLTVREISGKEIEVLLFGNRNIDICGVKKVRCIVKSIKKGILFLEISSD